MRIELRTDLSRDEMPHRIARDREVRSALAVVRDEHVDGPVRVDVRSEHRVAVPIAVRTLTDRGGRRVGRPRSSPGRTAARASP